VLIKAAHKTNDFSYLFPSIYHLSPFINNGVNISEESIFHYIVKLSKVGKISKGVFNLATPLKKDQKINPELSKEDYKNI
jgi:hypothetical protein